MAWPEVSEPTTAAAIVSAVLIAIGGVWRVVLKGLRDLRTNREGEVVSDSYVAIIRRHEIRLAAQDKEIAELRSAYNGDMVRLRDEWRAMRIQRDDALSRAMDAESKVARLTSRLGALEDQVRTLQRQ